MSDELIELNKLENELTDELENEIENLKLMLDTELIENINLYDIYLRINKLLNHRMIIRNRIMNIRMNQI